MSIQTGMKTVLAVVSEAVRAESSASQLSIDSDVSMRAAIPFAVAFSFLCRIACAICGIICERSR